MATLSFTFLLLLYGKAFYVVNVMGGAVGVDDGVDLVYGGLVSLLLRAFVCMTLMCSSFLMRYCCGCR